MKKEGVFITFEGGEGSGKTSAINFVAERMKKAGVDYLLTMEPGGTKIGEGIRKILLSPKSKGMAPETELMLYCASRSEHVRKVIKPALKDGKVVICDRFDDATIAYQGYGRGLKLDDIKKINSYVCEGLKPDLTILLDVDPVKGLKRASARNSKDGRWNEGRFEKEKIHFHNLVREGYLKIARSEKKRIKVIDSSVDLKKLQDSVWREIEAFLIQKELLLPFKES
ncbi:MAG: dTMP kinase [Candidatus Schekmanbacteria bacterium]|nr:MAG: dTMP kinase [Candidatus Schekmanbacteria bacterium]